MLDGCGLFCTFLCKGWLDGGGDSFALRFGVEILENSLFTCCICDLYGGNAAGAIF